MTSHPANAMLNLYASAFVPFGSMGRGTANDHSADIERQVFAAPWRQPRTSPRSGTIAAALTLTLIAAGVTLLIGI